MLSAFIWPFGKKCLLRRIGPIITHKSHNGIVLIKMRILKPKVNGEFDRNKSAIIIGFYKNSGSFRLNSRGQAIRAALLFENYLKFRLVFGIHPQIKTEAVIHQDFAD